MAALDPETLRVFRYIRKNPESTCEQIAGALGLQAAYLSVTLRALRGAKRLTSTGHTRGVKWTAV